MVDLRPGFAYLFSANGGWEPAKPHVRFAIDDRRVEFQYAGHQ